MVGKALGENLRLGFQPPERPRMDNAVAVPRIIGAIRVWLFRVAPPTRLPCMHGPRHEFRNGCNGWLRLGADAILGFLEHLQAAIGLVRNGRVWIFLLDLL